MGNMTIIRQRCADVATSLNLPFDYGRGNHVNAFSEGTDYLSWLVTDSFTINSTFIPNGTTKLYKSYSFEVFFYKENQVSSDNEVTQEIVEELEPFADAFLISFQDTYSDYDNITGRIVPVHKYSAKRIYTGVAMVITLQVPDNITYC